MFHSSGSVAELMADFDRAMSCYESALRHNPYSIPALTQIAALFRIREQFARVRVYRLLSLFCF